MIEALGIRFARAARFEPPELLQWDGTWLGEFEPACPQPPGGRTLTSHDPSRAIEGTLTTSAVVMGHLRLPPPAFEL